MAITAGEGGGIAMPSGSAGTARGVGTMPKKSLPSSFNPVGGMGAIQPMTSIPPNPYASAPMPGYTAPVGSPYYQPQNQAPAQPQPEPMVQQQGPAAGGMAEYNMFNPDQRAAADSAWLGGDSDFTAQTGLYQKALDDFVARIAGRIQGFNQDAQDVTAATNRNETSATNSLGEDFGARGLAYSGLFGQAMDKTRGRFADTKANIEKNRSGNVRGAENEQADYTAENQISRDNARRASLLRMAQQQSLIDSGGF